MLTSTLLILGLVFIGRLPVDLLPTIEYPQVRINVSNPGVEPVVLEETVAKPLEAALAVTEGVTRMETQVREGWVEAGAPVTLLERPHPEWTVAQAFELMLDARAPEELRQGLSRCPALPEKWRLRLASSG